MEPIRVTALELYAKDNAKDNKTLEYDLVTSVDVPTPIFRRGCNFFFSVRFDRAYDPKHDAVRVQLLFGTCTFIIDLLLGNFSSTELLYTLSKNKKIHYALTKML